MVDLDTFTFSGSKSDEIIDTLSTKYGDAAEEVFDIMLSNPKLFTLNYDEDKLIDDFDEGLEAAVETLVEPIDEEDFGDLFDTSEIVLPSKPQGASRSRLIGCDYKGVKSIKRQIKEYDNKFIFIPNSYQCLFDCYMMYILKNKKEVDTEKFKTLYLKQTTAKGITSLMFNKILKDLEIDFRIPKFSIWIENGIVKYGKKMGRDKNDVSDYFIGLMYLGYGTYHALLIKGASPSKAKLTKEDITIEFEFDKRIICDTRYNMNQPIKEHKRYVTVYDIETCIVPKEVPVPGKKTKKIVEALVPITLGFAVIDLHKSEDYVIHKNILMAEDNWEYLYYEMMYQVSKCLPDEKEYLIFAHNGSRFDNLYVRMLKHIEVVSAIKNGNQYKNLEVKYKEKTFKYRDTVLFVTSSLKSACDTFGAEICKIDFDIIGKSKDWFIEHKKMEKDESITDWTIKEDNVKEDKDHIKYLKYDVLSLANLFVNAETMFRKLGLSMTNFLGLPGMAYYILRRQCFGMSKIKIPSHPTLVNFIRESIYGGRVIQWKTLFPQPKGTKFRELHGDKLIAIDLNSLYPSSMYYAGYPIGDPLPFHSDSFQELNQKTHYIAEVDIKIPNIKYPYHPYSESNGKNKKLLYKSNQTITGVYNDVDIREMILDGYEVTKVHRAIYWTRSKRIFSNLIDLLYNKRKEYKTMKNNGNPEGNIEYIIKILLNAMYGKFNESIKEVTLYKSTVTDKAGREVLREIPLPNDQTEVICKYFHTKVTKPTQIASYVLSYSRALVNEIIRTVKPENIYYSDTDSLYLPLNQFNELKSKKMFNGGLNNELCGFKNDYGDNKYITKAVFLDLKRYYIKLEEEKDGETKIDFEFKFNGLRFKSAKYITNFFTSEMIPIAEDDREREDLTDTRIEQVAYDLYKGYYLHNENFIEQTKTLKEKLLPIASAVLTNNLEKKIGTDKSDVVIIQRDKEVNFSVNPRSRGQWNVLENQEHPEYSGLGFSYDIPEYFKWTNPNEKHVGKIQARESKKDLIKMSSHGDKDNNIFSIKSSSIPLIKGKINQHIFNKNTNYETVSNFYLIDNNSKMVIYANDRTDKNKDTRLNELYTVNAFGVLSKYELSEEEKKVLKPILFINYKDENSLEEFKNMYGNNVIYQNEQCFKMLMNNIKKMNK